MVPPRLPRTAREKTIDEFQEGAIPVHR
jgi:hypothetical protein